MTVYLLSITPPLHHAAHYIGYTDHDTIDKRLEKHLSGNGAKLIRAAIAAGSTIDIVHVWPGKCRKFERKLKKRGGASRWCPHCLGHYRKLPK